MQFPAWVHGPKRSKVQRAKARLKFIINQLAAQYTERATLRALAERVGLDHSTICVYIRRGAFTESAAQKIVDALDCASTVTVSDLIDPLSIKTQ